MTIGSLVFITPLLGIPHSWKEPALFTFGVLTILTGLLYRMETRRRERHVDDVAHAENNPNLGEGDTARTAF